MSSARAFSGSYSPGGHVADRVDQALARHRAARRGGLESGRIRRQLARGRKRDQLGADLGLDHDLRPPRRCEFDARYERTFPRPERACAVASWERGRDAVWQHLISTWRLVCARGQHCGTTNGQRAAALSSRALPPASGGSAGPDDGARCRRSVQHYHRRLEAIGMCAFLHVRKPPGQRDYLRIEWRIHRRSTSSVAPPLRERTTPTTSGSCPRARQRPNSLIPPASPADDEPPGKPADRPGTDEERLEAAARFRQLKLDLGWPVQEGSGQVTDRIDSITTAGFR